MVLVFKKLRCLYNLNMTEFFLKKSLPFVENIFYGERLLAIILRSDFKKNGIEFFTPNDFSQQLGYMKRDEGYEIPPHVHNPVKRSVEYTKEVLFIKSGKVRVDFYSEDKEYLRSLILSKGDIILLAFGGHGFKMLNEAEIVEVKQGPYAGDSDKTRFKAISESEVRYK